MQITLAAFQIRIFKLLPTVEIESHLIEIQKVGDLWVPPQV
jgi:hypothetical protein